MSKPKAIYILAADKLDDIYGPEEQAAIADLVELVAEAQTPASVKESPEVLADVEIILSGWGGPKLDEEFLASAPNLKAFLYGAGTVKNNVTDAMWDRDIIVTSAYAANAVPVAEFTLAQIILSLKKFYQHVDAYRLGSGRPRVDTPGGFGATIALISMGAIGRIVRKLLRQLDVKVLAYDPFLSDVDVALLGIERVTLEEAFSRADVVSLHTPLLPETINMVTGEHFRLMKQGATFINTARGQIVDEPAMISVLKHRPDLTAILDVTHPEPPADDSELFTLPNVVLSPHIAGSMASECRRMGQYVVRELECYLAGEPQVWPIDRESFARHA